MSGRPPANRMMLGQFKAKLVGAKKGHGLLKKKRDALKARFHQMLKEIVVCKRGVAEGIKDCSFQTAKTTWAAGNVSATVLEKVHKPSVGLSTGTENIAGVILPKFVLDRDAELDKVYNNLGMGEGGQVIQTNRSQHVDTLLLLVRMASLQTAFLTLDRAIQTCSRRVNALEFVVIPKIDDVISYIKTEMDEMEREEFFRVKKVVANKRKKIEEDGLLAMMAEAEAASKKSAGSDQYSGMMRPTMADPEVVYGANDNFD